MGDMEIRAVKEDDKEAITDLVKEFVTSLNEPFYESLWMTLLESYFVGLSVKELAFTDIGIFCADDSQKLVGCVVAEVEQDLLKRKFGDISLWFVKAEARGQRVGKKLLEAAVKFLKEKGVTIIESNIREETIAAAKIFEDLGFNKRYTRLRLTL